MSVWDKLNPGLASVYANYLKVKKGESVGGHVHRVVAGSQRLNITLTFTGNINEIEPLGFQTTSTPFPGNATGTIDLANVEKLAASPAVVRMSFGRPKKIRLDKSVPDIAANKVWTLSGGTFTGDAGQGVIIGIIDTGIDIKHRYFLKSMNTPLETRILKIWDQGLLPQGGDKQPDPSFLSTANTYGVEYGIAEINAKLGGAGNFRHKDCDGHGTHVASIAAGNGQDKFQFVGVAPQADLIVVKHLYPQNVPQVNGGDLDESIRFKDAVLYILNSAKKTFSNRPVVINCSFGTDLGPHDGFTEEEDWVKETFNGAVGQAIVFSAGNAGRQRLSGRVKFSGAGTIQIPFELFDDRTDRSEYSLCKYQDMTESTGIDLYYAVGGAVISVGLQLPNTTPFIPGPVLGAAGNVSGDYSGRHYSMIHQKDNVTLKSGGSVERNHFGVTFEPRVVGNDKLHLTGTYTLEIKSDSAATVFIWCDATDYGMRFKGTSSDPSLLTIDEQFQIGEDAGASNAIAVACYSAEDVDEPLTFFSSRGPLVDYGSGIAQPDKPDIAAPGENIDAAKSQDAKPKAKKDLTISYSGTSMAAPHVAGVVALMLQKNPALTIGQIASTLKTAARSITFPEIKDEFGAGRLDAEQAVDTTP